MRRVPSALVATLLATACSEDSGIGVQITDHSDLIGAGSASVDVFVSRDCFYAVTVGGVLRKSGRWKEGQENVPIPSLALARCENTVRVEVAAEDGSAAWDEEVVTYCRNDCAEECDGQYEPDSGVQPDPDSGVVGPDSGPSDPRFEHLCELCEGYPDDCGGPPNLCINYPGGPLCGIDCSEDPTCPTFFDCYQATNDYGQTIGWVCLPDPLWSKCLY